MVGIWGMGGIGKTTLAKVAFHKLKAHFEAFSFVENVREQLQRNGLDRLREKCLKDLLKGDDIHIYNMKSTFVKHSLGRKKILLILDDVDNLITAEDLAILCDWFGEVSRVIITSRDTQVLKNASASSTYHVQELEFNDALHLFSLKAFKQNEPFGSYLELSKWVVDYCHGNPLALVVLGGFLYGRTKQEWESALEKLKQAPHKDVFNVLKLSFDRLDVNQKNIFHDLAYLLREASKISLNFIVDFYDSSAYIDIIVLKDLSLISIDKSDEIKMHDLVRETSLEISRQQLLIDPEKPVRLWRHRDIYHFFINNKGCGTIRYISLDMSRTKRIILPPDAFQKMYELKFLKFYKSDLKEPPKVYIFEGLENLPEELRCLFWEEYPLPSVPLSFCADNLLELEMPQNHLQQLWDGDQHFPNLQLMNLIGSKHLIDLPDLSHVPNIRMIYLDECGNLAQIQSSSILSKLSHLSIGDCKKIRLINIGGNIKETSSGLVATYNFLDLINLSFHKFTVKLFISSHANTFSGFRIKLVSVSFREISSWPDQCMDNAKLNFSSLLPFVTPIRWLDLPIEFGSFNKHYDYISSHEHHTVEQPKDINMNDPTVAPRDILGLEDQKIITEEVTDYHISDGAKWRALEIEEKDEIIRSNIIVPGISILRSLAEFDCKSIQPLVDFRMSLDNGSTLWGGHEISAAATQKSNEPADLNVDIWQPLAGGFYADLPINLHRDIIWFLFLFQPRKDTEMKLELGPHPDNFSP
ncbi:disease resistance protein RPV1-like [Prosopis cineraria]|uniref:disease resistance protein RPV1-like n=1 Tax=Prosopis cineraria TaxID=364024 RepID=UPI00240F168D|nr:disease resistance protein RPV1-like [Prosopis cineraria]